MLVVVSASWDNDQRRSTQKRGVLRYFVVLRYVRASRDPMARTISAPRPRHDIKLVNHGQRITIRCCAVPRQHPCVWVDPEIRPPQRLCTLIADSVEGAPAADSVVSDILPRAGGVRCIRFQVAPVGGERCGAASLHVVLAVVFERVEEDFICDGRLCPTRPQLLGEFLCRSKLVCRALNRKSVIRVRSFVLFCFCWARWWAIG